MLRDCNTPATRPSCSLEPVPGRIPHPSSYKDYKAGESQEEIITSDSGDINWRVNSDLSDPNHKEGAADNPDIPGSDDKELSELGDQASDSGTLSDQIKLFPINCERAKYIEVISELSELFGFAIRTYILVIMLHDVSLNTLPSIIHHRFI